MMEQETFPVRPLGKYGHIYLLDKPTRQLYRLWNIAVGIIMTVLAVMQIIVPRIVKPLPWPLDLPLLLMISALALGVSGMLAIASRGKIVSEKEIGTIDPPNQCFSSAIHGMQRAYNWNLYISSGIIFCVAMLYIVGQLLTGSPIHYSVLVLLIPFGVVFIIVLIKRCLARKRNRRLQSR